MEAELGAAIIGAIAASLGSILTGVFLFWLQGRRLRQQWEREDRIRNEELHLEWMEKVVEHLEFGLRRLKDWRDSDYAYTPEERANIISEILLQEDSVREARRIMLDSLDSFEDQEDK